MTITEANEEHALLELRNICKYFGNVTALENITTRVEAGKVTCVLGDNGAGKSTFIKILSGVHQPSSGEYTMYGTPVQFTSPRDARNAGIAAVFQDLALAPLLSIWRNFFLGVEPMHAGILMRTAFMKKTAKEEMAKMGIDLRDVDQPVGTLSGGERQSVAIARAVYFGARVLILDEPTSALGVKPAAINARTRRSPPAGSSVASHRISTSRASESRTGSRVASRASSEIAPSASVAASSTRPCSTSNCASACGGLCGAG